MTTQSDVRPQEPHPVLTSHHFWGRLGSIWAALRRLDKRDAQRDDITLYVDEYLPPQVGVSINIPPQVSNPIIVESFIAYSSAGTATVTIGDHIIPIVQGLTVISSISMLRREASNSTLVTGVSGILYLEIMGRQIPRMVE